jgi:hypothetical protein
MELNIKFLFLNFLNLCGNIDMMQDHINNGSCEFMEFLTAPFYPINGAVRAIRTVYMIIAG